MIRIENWAIVQNMPYAEYTPPELVSRSLVGEVYSHPCFNDGRSITSSALVELDLKNMTAKTKSGSEYVLGDPYPNYAEYMGELVGKRGDSSSDNPFPANSKASEYWLKGFKNGCSYYP